MVSMAPPTVTHYGPPVASYNGITVIQCLTCYRRHLDPLPDPLDLTRYYTDPYGFYFNSERWFATEADHHRRGYWDALYRWEASLLAKHLRPAVRLIDLGAGSGWFIKWWGDNIGRAVGVEPSPVARSNSPVPARLFPTLEEASRKFAGGNPVYLRARLVLEHLVDPVGFLREAVGIPQRVNGIIIHVPNEFTSIQDKIVKRDGVGYWLIDKVHVNYFDKRSLNTVLQEAGFEAVFWGASCPIELFQIAGFRYVGNDKKGQQVHLARLKFEKALGSLAWRIYKFLYDQKGWGREIICIAKPKEL